MYIVGLEAKRSGISTKKEVAMPRLSREIGTNFNEQFIQAAKKAGYYIQQIPMKVEFDFILGIRNNF